MSGRSVSEVTLMVGPDELVVREMYASINRRDMNALRKVFARDAIWHGAGQEVRGADRIAQLVQTLIDASARTLHIDLHDVVANDEHVVALQTTRAQRGERHLVDRVVYVFHVRDGRISDAWFHGDPRIQDEFWSTPEVP
jgi:uncharacterized protein